MKRETDPPVDDDQARAHAKYIARLLIRNPTSNSELLIMVTPEIVRPIPAGQPKPELEMPRPFLKDAPKDMPRTPGMDVTGPVPTTCSISRSMRASHSGLREIR